jgi:tetratricopeptide (TPR) repeat protein
LLQAERAEWLFRLVAEESQSEVAETSPSEVVVESLGSVQLLAGQGQQLAFYVLSQANSAALNQQLIRDLSYRALGVQVTNLLETNAMSEARNLIARFPDDCADSVFCINTLEQFYMRLGQQHWAQRDWPGAIFIYEEYLARRLQTSNGQVFENNLQSAYLNQAEQHWFDEERDEAIAILEVCVITVATPERCQQRLQSARQGR